MQVNGRKVVSNLKIGKLCAIIASFFVMIFCCFTLTACDHFPNCINFTQEELSDIVSVELIKYDNPKQKMFLYWTHGNSYELKPFDESKVSALETLDGDKISQFIDTLCEFDIDEKHYECDSPNGLCIKLTYSNGDFLILNTKFNSANIGRRGYIGRYSPSGEVTEFIGTFCNNGNLGTLITDFFQYNI